MDYTALIVGFSSLAVLVVGGILALYQRLAKVEASVVNLRAEMREEHSENRQEHRDLYSKTNQIDRVMQSGFGELRGRGMMNGKDKDG